VVEDLLVNGDLDSAARLIDLLDQEGLRVRGAMWLYESDAERWRFTICFNEPREHPISFYRDMARVTNAHQEIDTLSLDRVSVVAYDGSIFSKLRGVIEVGGTSRVRMTHNRINGVYLEDAIIYRLEA
jgi:hypothetical protein